MTTLRFIESDLEKWARFSNDYNPIHFDKNFAKKFGLDDVVVHGMLGINHIFRSVETNDVDESLSIKCVLKKPLPVNSDIKLEKLDGKVRLVDNKSGNMLFMANVSYSGKWDNKKFYPELYEISNINDKLHELMRLYPEKKIWILINSIVFSEYIASHGQFLSREISNWKKNITIQMMVNLW